MKIIAAIWMMCIMFSVTVQAEFTGPEFIGPDVPRTILTDTQGNEVLITKKSGTVYVTARETEIYMLPDEESEILHRVVMGTMLTRTGECGNGWVEVSYQLNGENKVNGYIQIQTVNETFPMERCNDVFTALSDSEILDYPGVKDGEVIGEILEFDEVKCTGTLYDIWARILFEDMSGKKQTGYVPLAVFQEEDSGLSSEIDETVEAGTLSVSDGEGVFADAIEGVEEMIEGEAEADPGVQVGKPLAASSEATLTDLGVFVITHYCPCSICCGPWANGITSTGVTAVTNRTVAVDPTIIPYGSKLVINGQVYVAEDCGGAIKGKRIDIYVGSHAEGNQKGKYATDVYLLEQ